MAALLSYIRAVGTKAEIETVEHLIQQLELGMTLDDLMSIVCSIGWSYLPHDLKIRLLAALQEAKKTYKQDIDNYVVDYTNNNSITVYENLIEQYNLLNYKMQHGAFIVSDLTIPTHFIERINDNLMTDYKPLYESGSVTVFKNTEGEFIYHDSKLEVQPSLDKQYADILKLLDNAPKDDIGDGLRTDIEEAIQKGCLQIHLGEEPELNSFEVCQELAFQSGITVLPYDKLKPIPKGMQREHIVCHSGMYGAYKKKGQSRKSVAIANDFGAYNEGNGLCFFVDDAQKHGTEHKILTDRDRKFARDHKNANGGESFATLEEWIVQKEKSIIMMLESNTLKHPKVEGRSDDFSNTTAKRAAKAIMNATRIHMTNLGADLNAKVSNRLAFGSIPPQNLV